MEQILDKVKTHSSPADLRITDMRVAFVVGAPMKCPIIKIMTNQGIEGYGEVRDGAHPNYALMLKRLILGENPCNVDKLFKKIKPFGGHARSGGGVSAIELALWDIVGKAYGVPVYQLLGGKYRDSVRMYCDTDVEGKNTGKAMGEALKKRRDVNGFTFLKMDLGIRLIQDEPGALSAPLGHLESFNEVNKKIQEAVKAGDQMQARWWRNRLTDLSNIPHPMTGIHITEKGFELLEEYVREVREVLGTDIPLAVDHFGHIGVEDCMKLAKRIDKYNLAWLEDMVPWFYTEQLVKLSKVSTTPLATGEDIYLKENFKPLLESGAVSVIHPDILTTGGVMETKKIGDMAQGYGVAMAVHMAETPVACMAAVHACAATENFLALEFHSNDVPWWQTMVNGLPKPVFNHGFIDVPETPGFGITSLNDEVLKEHANPAYPKLWASTEEWDEWTSNDRTWS